MVRAVPAEGVGLDDVGQPGLVREEEGQVRGQDAVLHVPQHLLVFIRAQLAEYIVMLLKNGDKLVKVGVGILLLEM